VEDDVFEEESLNQFFEVVKEKKADVYNLWKKLGPFYYGPRPQEFKDTTSMTSYFI